MTDILADLGTSLPLGGSLLVAVYLLIKAGPAWSQSLLKTAREEAAGLSKTLDECRAGRAVAESEKRAAVERAERYRLQLIRAGITPYDEATV